MILGIDEVGRGPWAGPLVVGAVVLPQDFLLDGLTDSKKLSAKKRVELAEIIKKEALGYGLGWVEAEELDSVGLSAALRLATIRAVEAVKTPYHEIIIDGTINFLSETSKGQFVTTMPKADFLVPAVSAASIIAKVARDAYMAEQDAVYPEYGFGAHVGYGTAKHSAALQQFGVTPLHRKSFAPIAKLLGGLNSSAQAARHPGARATTKDIGDTGEQAAVEYLQNAGYQIIERNWKTKYCEIDIIAQKQEQVYFIEVKYRSSEAQGGGVAAITPQKLQKMHFAAELYVHNHPHAYGQQLMVAIVKKDKSIELVEVS